MTQERELCAVARILPAQYLAIKAGLLTAEGPGVPQHVARLLDRQRMSLVMELLQARLPAATARHGASTGLICCCCCWGWASHTRYARSLQPQEPCMQACGWLPVPGVAPPSSAGVPAASPAGSSGSEALHVPGENGLLPAGSAQLTGDEHTSVRPRTAGGAQPPTRAPAVARRLARDQARELEARQWADSHRGHAGIIGGPGARALRRAAALHRSPPGALHSALLGFSAWLLLRLLGELSLQACSALALTDKPCRLSAA